MRDRLAKWIEGGAFVEEDGRPATFFHGTDVHEPFNIFTRFEDQSLGFHFGSVEAANDRLAQIFRMAPPDENEGIVIPVHCRAQNPLRMDDLYTWGQRAVVSALVDAGVASEDEAEFLEESASAEMLFAVIEEAGYDCIVYRNLCEAGISAHDSILVWRAELLKSPYSLDFSLDDPRLLSQNETAESDLSDWECVSDFIDKCRRELNEFKGVDARLTATL
jgi:hypothetical protein